MKNLLKNFRWYEYILILLNVAILVTRVYFEVAIIDRMTELVEKVQLGEGTEAVRNAGAYMLADSLAIMLCALVSSTLVSFLASKFSQRVRAKVFAAANGFSQKEINLFTTSSLITRCTDDITQIQKTLQMSLKIGVLAPAMGVFSIVKMTSYDITLSLVTAVAIAAIFALFALSFFLTLPMSAKTQKMTDKLNTLTAENIAGVKVIRAYNVQTKQAEKFGRANAKFTKINLYSTCVSGLMNPFMDLIFNGLCLVVYWFGARLVNMSALEYGNLMGFSRYGANILTWSMLLSSLIILLSRAVASGKRIAAVLDTQPSVVFGTFDGQTKTAGLLEFRNVSFAYPDCSVKALDGINFVASVGETIAIIGPTGSGKSTLVNLIPRFFDPTSGEILLDGVNIKEYSHDALSGKIGFVPQTSVLFAGSIRDNVGYGADGISDKAIEQALEIAQADFVKTLDGGLDFVVARGGSNLSGGQRQRLCIARAIAKDPEIYIFDDSFSALDYKTDRALRQTLEEHTTNATKIIVAQRIGTIMNADKIIVLNGGGIVGMGKHDELIKTCDIYREIAASQLPKEVISR